MNELVIKTNNLTKVYKNQKALDNVSLSLEKGSIYGLVGENGSGKSTTLKAILGLINPNSGNIEIYGETGETKLSEGRKTIGCIIESPAFFPYMSAKKNLEYYRVQRGLTDKKVVEETLNLVGLGSVGNKKFKTFSLGMKQRLGIAYCLLINPEILILDEPINGLDPKGIMDLRKLILKLNKEKDITVLISSHILDELSHIATNYGFMKHGKLIKEITAAQLDEECRKFLRIKVDDISKATLLLEEELKTLDYKVNNQEEIYLYEFINESDKVIEVFYKSGIKIKSINQEGVRLEEYYMDLVGGNKNA